MQRFCSTRIKPIVTHSGDNRVIHIKRALIGLETGFDWLVRKQFIAKSIEGRCDRRVIMKNQKTKDKSFKMNSVKKRKRNNMNKVSLVGAHYITQYHLLCI